MNAFEQIVLNDLNERAYESVLSFDAMAIKCFGRSLQRVVNPSTLHESRQVHAPCDAVVTPGGLSSQLIPWFGKPRSDAAFGVATISRGARKQPTGLRSVR